MAKVETKRPGIMNTTMERFWKCHEMNTAKQEGFLARIKNLYTRDIIFN